MIMRKLLLLLLSVTFFTSCENTQNTSTEEPSTVNTEEVNPEEEPANRGPLYKIFEGEEDEIFAKTGYVNAAGDTVIAMGKYKYCFTDTLVNYAIVMDQDNVCKAIDSNEKVLYEVKWYDNGPDYISDGLFRIIIEGKTGYANKAGEIVIEPIYACTEPFEGGQARVTLKCELSKDGEYTRMESDEWFSIDTKGNKIAE